MVTFWVLTASLAFFLVRGARLVNRRSDFVELHELSPENEERGDGIGLSS